MHGLMMDSPLLISALLRHADREHGDTELVSRTLEGPIHRYTYSQAHRRTRRCANALISLGVAPADCVATLAWNGFRHFELFYAIAGIGAVCHTVNPRLFPEQIRFILNHAADSHVFVDPSFVPLLEKLAGGLARAPRCVVMTDRAHMPQSSLPDLLCYEELIDAMPDDFDWPTFDERTASSLCYTSGTTGNPKGVLYSHRSTVLHAYAAALPDSLGVSARDVIMPIVPMFHANAWGIPYIVALTGAKLVLPGSALDGGHLWDLLEQEKVTIAAGVPTVWLALLNHLKHHGLKVSTLRRVLVGGAACPPAIIRAFEDDHGVSVLHAWGMTETGPLGTLGTPKRKHADLSVEQRRALQAKQGRPIFGVEISIVDDAGRELPHDGKAFGHLMIRGPWVASGYFKAEDADPLRGGFFPTGDVATIDADGYMQITDRSKDVIKSGGEWISSIDLENAVVDHPAIAEAAVIGVPHPKWDERPLLIVVRKTGAAVTRSDLYEFLGGKIAKWWMPDEIVFVDSLPHSATGKLLKTELRRQYRDYPLPSADRRS